MDGEKVTDVDRAVLIANFYYTTPYMGYRAFKDYLNQIHVDQHDIIAYMDHLQNELDFILDVQDEINYQHQVEKLHKIVPQKVEAIIERDFVEEVLTLNKEVIAHNPELAKETLIEATVVAYRFQIKYCLMALMQIVNDGEVWAKKDNKALEPERLWLGDLDEIFED